MKDSGLQLVIEDLRPYVATFLIVSGLVVFLVAPLPGRGPRLFARRDPWRGFKFAARRTVMARAGGRCEAPVFLAWGRCRATAIEVDHIYPWSRGGPTVVSNGQALCRAHNRRKSNLRPPWWYVRSLEKRRGTYVGPGVELRVRGRMNDLERAARAAWKHRRASGLGTSGDSRLS